MYPLLVLAKHNLVMVFYVFFIFERKEKSTVPFIVISCIREVEKRGMHEVGIYRVSGSASDVQRLKKSFETSM